MTNRMTNKSPSETEVIAWLHEHPDFLTRQPELFAQLGVPHDAGAASLIEKQVEILRNENRRLKRQLEHLSTVAGENERLMQQLHGLALGLVATDSYDALYRRLCQGLCDDFRADRVCLLLDDKLASQFDDAEISRLPAKPPDWMEKLLADGTPQCGRLTRQKRETVFGAAGASLGSAALVPLFGQGLLGIGSDSGDRFHPGMGTLFLELLRETLQFRLGMDADEDEKRRQRA